MSDWRQQLADAATLCDDWDGEGAPSICTAGLTNARAMLDALAAIGYAPDDVFPTNAGTVSAEWDAGAVLEIGRTKFSFYTMPTPHKFLGGLVSEWDKQAMRDALASIMPSGEYTSGE